MAGERPAPETRRGSRSRPSSTAPRARSPGTGPRRRPAARRLPGSAEARAVRPGLAAHDVGGARARRRRLARAERRRAAQAHAGSDWPAYGAHHGRPGASRRSQACVREVVADDVPGDLIEPGAWRGGASMLMRATLDVLGDERGVCVADSFAGFRENLESEDLAEVDYLAVSLEEVRANFARFGLDEGVEFVPGYFEQTMAGLARADVGDLPPGRRQLRGHARVPRRALPRPVGGRLPRRRRLPCSTSAPGRWTSSGPSTASTSRWSAWTGPARAGGAAPAPDLSEPLRSARSGERPRGRGRSPFAAHGPRAGSRGLFDIEYISTHASTLSGSARSTSPSSRADRSGRANTRMPASRSLS